MDQYRRRQHRAQRQRLSVADETFNALAQQRVKAAQDMDAPEAALAREIADAYLTAARWCRHAKNLIETVEIREAGP